MAPSEIALSRKARSEEAILVAVGDGSLSRAPHHACHRSLDCIRWREHSKSGGTRAQARIGQGGGGGARRSEPRRSGWGGGALDSVEEGGKLVEAPLGQAVLSGEPIDLLLLLLRLARLALLRIHRGGDHADEEGHHHQGGE